MSVATKTQSVTNTKLALATAALLIASGLAFIAVPAAHQSRVASSKEILHPKCVDGISGVMYQCHSFKEIQVIKDGCKKTRKALLAQAEESCGGMVIRAEQVQLRQILDYQGSGLKAFPTESRCRAAGGNAAGGDKESANMLVGQEDWEQDYLEYSPNDFIPLLPGHIQERLGALNGNTNCFFSAVDYHIPQDTDRIMTNRELEQILEEDFCELGADTPIEFADLITVENPNERGYNNFHHAAVVLSRNFLFDKPDSYASSSARITPMSTLFDEWGHYWNCPEPWPQDGDYKCLLIRYWQYVGN